MEESQFSPEPNRAKEHPLNGTVIVHGFLGNINKYEGATVAQFIEKGKLTSPSKRQLEQNELDRLKNEAPFDRNRICFHTWSESRENEASYIGQAVWAAPVTAMENLIIGDDIAGGGGDIFVYKEEGAEIGMNKGILYISDELMGVNSVRESIENRARQVGIAYGEWVEKNVVLVPAKVFREPEKLFNIISRRIQPANGVAAEFVSRDEFNQVTRLNFATSLGKNHAPASIHALGNSSKIEGESVAPEMLDKWQDEYLNLKKTFDEIEEEMEENPLRLEELRIPEYEHDSGWQFHLLKQRMKLFASGSDLAKQIAELDNRRQMLLKRNEVILEDRFPNAPNIGDIMKDRKSRIRKGFNVNFDTFAYKDESDRFRVNQTIF